MKLQKKDDEIYDLNGVIKDLKSEIEHLKREVNDNTKESLQIMDLKLKYEGEIEKRDQDIIHFSGDIIKLREEMRLKD